MKLRSAFLVSLFFFVSISVAQANNLPITVVANESITITLFFPSEINKVIKPAVNYKFEYERHSTMGTLVARKGATSNLTVITKDGSIFSFLLQYEQEVDNFTYVLSTDQAIGKMEPVSSVATNSTTTTTTTKKEIETLEGNKTLNEAPKRDDDKLESDQKVLREPLVESNQADDENRNNEAAKFPKIATSEPSESEISNNNLYDTDRESYYEIFCENNYNQGVRLKDDFKAGVGVELQLNSITADKDEFYFVFQVTNRLTTLFNAEKLRFYVRTMRKDEPLHMTPIYVFNHQDSIEAGRTKKMVYVLKDFRLSKDQKVFVVLNEQDGARNTTLKIDSRTINAVAEKSVSSTR